MVWRSHADQETTGTGIPPNVSTADWDEAGQFRTAWVDTALATSAITLPGDGKYRVTYSGAQNLDTISGTTDGDVVILRADVTGAGASLTIRNNGGGTGNIRTNAGVDIVLAGDGEWAMFLHIGSVLTGGVLYGAA